MEDKNIIIYTSTTCPYCEMAKDYFKTKGIPYEEKSTAEPENRKKLVSLGIRGVPTIFVGEKYFVGFDPVEIEKLMAGPDAAQEEVLSEAEIIPKDVRPVEPVQGEAQADMAKDADRAPGGEPASKTENQN